MSKDKTIKIWQLPSFWINEQGSKSDSYQQEEPVVSQPVVPKSDNQYSGISSDIWGNTAVEKPLMKQD